MGPRRRVATGRRAPCSARALLPPAAAPRPAGHAAQTQCGSLGEAANFAVFSDGDFNASQAAGTSINGRIATAGDVTLDGVPVNPAAGDPSPTVVAAGDFTAGRTTGNGGSLNGGIRVQGTIDIAQN